MLGNDGNVLSRLTPLAYRQDSGLAAEHAVVRRFGVRLETRSSHDSGRDYDFAQPRLRGHTLQIALETDQP